MAIKGRACGIGLKDKKKIGRIGVLMGGVSSEREISLKSGKAVCEGINRLGLPVFAIDIISDSPQKIIRLIKSAKIDCAFLALHGRFGEDGQMQGILDHLRIPYTGSGKLASQLAMDKISSRKIFQVHGLMVPKCVVLDRVSYSAHWHIGKNIKPPFVVKPASNGSSLGLSIVENPRGLNKAIDLAFRFDQRALVEEYIQGREMTVGILESRPLPVIEIIPKNKFFDYEAKYQSSLTEYIVPAKIGKNTAKKLQDTGLLAHNLLGCLGCSRVDIILNQDGSPFVLEVNSIPGFTKNSLLPKAALAMGIGFDSLCLRLIKLALEKQAFRYSAYEK